MTEGSLAYPDIRKEPFQITGFPWIGEDGLYRRLPARIARNVSGRVEWLSADTAGGMLRFKTDSGILKIEAKLLGQNPVTPNISACGRSGIDVYARRDDSQKEKFIRCAAPGMGENPRGYDPVRETAVSAVIDEPAGLPLEGRSALIEYRIYFPNYDGVLSLSIGLAPDCRILPPDPFDCEFPIVFYGSSITQGGCASRPGNAYAHILCRRLNAAMVNFGFSGAGRGEPLMARTIAGLRMSAFVMDYDFNAPDAGHLRKTHEPFFRIIREAHPDLPVVLVSNPCHEFVRDNERRKEVILDTYRRALAGGDRNVRFVDGDGLLGGEDRDACTVDTVHPNDLGMARMAEGIYPALREALAEDTDGT